MSAIYELVILFAILAVVVETKGEYKYISLFFFFFCYFHNHWTLARYIFCMPNNKRKAMPLAVTKLNLWRCGKHLACFSKIRAVITIEVQWIERNLFCHVCVCVCAFVRTQKKSPILIVNTWCLSWVKFLIVTSTQKCQISRIFSTWNVSERLLKIAPLKRHIDCQP